MSVNLDYRPGTPARLTGRTDDAFEIPTLPSDLQDLKAQLLQLDLPAIGRQVRQTLASAQHVTEELGTRVGPLADGLQSTLATATEAVHQLQLDSARTLRDIDRLANESRQQITTNGDDLDQVLKKAGEAIDRADILIESLNEMTSPRVIFRRLFATSLLVRVPCASLRTTWSEIHWEHCCGGANDAPTSNSTGCIDRNRRRLSVAPRIPAHLLFGRRG